MKVKPMHAQFNWERLCNIFNSAIDQKFLKTNDGVWNVCAEIIKSLDPVLLLKNKTKDSHKYVLPVIWDSSRTIGSDVVS